MISEEIYKYAMEFIDRLMAGDPEPESPEGVLLNILDKAVKEYEEHHGMACNEVH